MNMTYKHLFSNRKMKMTYKRLLVITAGMLLFGLAGCGFAEKNEEAAAAFSSGNQTEAVSAEKNEEAVSAETETPPLSKFPIADMSGYAGLSDTAEKAVYRDVTVTDVAALIDEKETFALLASFPDCPWCNAAIDNINRAAMEAGFEIASMNTRRDPSWTSNLEMDDYDLFTEYFGRFLENDENGIPHLYVPHMFFIRDGEVVYEHQGAMPEMGNDPMMELTEEQEETLTDIFREGFQRIAG